MITQEYHRPNFGGRVCLDEYISDLNLEISSDGYSCKPMCKDGFAYMWAGAKATYGIRKGKVCFEVKIAENVEVSTADFTDIHVVRVGWSTDAATLQLGEDKNSFGYGGTAKKSESRKFSDYGRRFDKGDVIGCYLAIENGWADISYCVNGRHCGSAFKVRWNAEEALFPHVLSKNCRLEINFGQAPNPYFSLLPGFKLIDHIQVEMRIPAVSPPSNKRNCEVIMMVGLPGVGKSTWAMNYSKIHPSKKYNILGTDAIIDKMRIQGLPRKNNFGGRWDVLIKQASECFNTLLKKASICTRNLILDQTNVYASARKRKVSQYKDAGYTVNAMVLVPTDEDMLRRSKQRTLEEGKEVPQAAVYDMKANFSLPHENENLFNDITFLELQRREAEILVMQYNSDANMKGYKSNKRSGVGGNENQQERNESNNRFSSTYQQESENARRGYSRRQYSPDKRANDGSDRPSQRRERSRDYSPPRIRKSERKTQWDRNENTNRDAETNYKNHNDCAREAGPQEKYRRNSSSFDNNFAMNSLAKGGPVGELLQKFGKSDKREILPRDFEENVYRQESASVSKRRENQVEESFYNYSHLPKQRNHIDPPQNDSSGFKKNQGHGNLSREISDEKIHPDSLPQQYHGNAWEEASSGSFRFNIRDKPQGGNFDEAYQEKNYAAYIHAPKDRKFADDKNLAHHEFSTFRHNKDMHGIGPDSVSNTPQLAQVRHFHQNITTPIARKWDENSPSKWENPEFTPKSLSPGNFLLQHDYKDSYNEGHSRYGPNDDIETAKQEIHNFGADGEYGFEDGHGDDWKNQDFSERRRHCFQPQSVQRYEHSQKISREKVEYGMYDEEPYDSEYKEKEEFNLKPNAMQSRNNGGYDAYFPEEPSLDDQVDNFYNAQSSHLNETQHFNQSSKPIVESNQFSQYRNYDRMTGTEFDTTERGGFANTSNKTQQSRLNDRSNQYRISKENAVKNNNEYLGFNEGTGISHEMTSGHSSWVSEDRTSTSLHQNDLYNDSEEKQDVDWNSGSRHDEHRRKLDRSFHDDNTDEYSDPTISKLSSADYDNLKASLANLRQAQRKPTSEMDYPDRVFHPDLKDTQYFERQLEETRSVEALEPAFHISEDTDLPVARQADHTSEKKNLFGKEPLGRRTPIRFSQHGSPNMQRRFCDKSPFSHNIQQSKMPTDYPRSRQDWGPLHSEDIQSFRHQVTDISSSNKIKPLLEKKIPMSGQEVQSHRVSNTSGRSEIYSKKDSPHIKETKYEYQRNSRERKQIHDNRDKKEYSSRGHFNRKFEDKRSSPNVPQKQFTSAVGRDYGKLNVKNNTETMQMPKFSDVRYDMDIESDMVNKSENWNQRKESEVVAKRTMVSDSPSELAENLPSLLDIPVQQRPGLLGAHPLSLTESDNKRENHKELPISRELPIMRMRSPRPALLGSDQVQFLIEDTPPLDIDLGFDDEYLRHPIPRMVRPRSGLGMGQVRPPFPRPGIQERLPPSFDVSGRHVPGSEAPIQRPRQGLLRRPLRYPAGVSSARIRLQEHNMLQRRFPIPGDGSPEMIRYRGVDPRFIRPMRMRFGHGPVGGMSRNRMPMGARSGHSTVPFGMRPRGPRARFG